MLERLTLSSGEVRWQLAGKLGFGVRVKLSVLKGGNVGEVYTTATTGGVPVPAAAFHTYSPLLDRLQALLHTITQSDIDDRPIELPDHPNYPRRLLVKTSTAVCPVRYSGRTHDDLRVYNQERRSK